MKLRFGTAAWLLVGLLSGPAAVVGVWTVAALAAASGFIVPPGAAPRYAGPQGAKPTSPRFTSPKSKVAARSAC